MAMDWGALAQGISNVASAHANWRQNAMNRDIQQTQFAESIRLSNTAHQREMADLEAAGLNPVLTATGGHGLGFPTGGSPGAIPIDFGGGEVMSSVRANQRLKKELELIESQIVSNGSAAEAAFTQAGKNRQDTNTSKALERQHDMVTRKIKEADIPFTKVETQIARDHQKGTAVEADIDQSAAGVVSRYIGRFLPTVNSAASASRAGSAASASRAGSYRRKK